VSTSLNRVELHKLSVVDSDNTLKFLISDHKVISLNYWYIQRTV